MGAAWGVRSHPAPDRPNAWFTHPEWRRWGAAVVVFDPKLEFERILSVPLGSGQPRYAGKLLQSPGQGAVMT